MEVPIPRSSGQSCAPKTSEPLHAGPELKAWLGEKTFPTSQPELLMHPDQMQSQTFAVTPPDYFIFDWMHVTN